MITFTRLAAFGLLATLLAGPAAAQIAGTAGAGSPEGAPKPQPRVPDIAPAGLPGAGTAPLATGPNLAKPETGDPTAALFAAVNSGDYNAAQDAVGRGANISAQNGTQITFLLLATRNETGGTAVANAPPPAAVTGHKTAKPVVRVSTPPVRMKPPVMGNAVGTPDPNAGFLGFGK
jgi:hypothetical protein